jgi:hypothetical protein
MRLDASARPEREKSSTGQRPWGVNRDHSSHVRKPTRQARSLRPAALRDDAEEWSKDHDAEEWSKDHDAEEWSKDHDAEEWSKDHDAEEWSKDHAINAQALMGLQPTWG